MSEIHSDHISMKNKGLKRIIKAIYYSYKGFIQAFRYEAAFRQEAFCALVLVPLALWLDVSKLERIAMISVVVLVMVVELLNTGIEAVVDRVGFEKHELAGRAKDMGSAAVFLSIGLGIFVWCSILLF